MSGAQLVVDETTLPAFRGAHLSPRAVYAALPATDEVLLVSAPPGVGKTYAAHGIIEHALARDHDLVIYIAPTRALIAELLAREALGARVATTVVLEPRPKSRCGPLDADWQRLEQSGCAALAKSSLCTVCPHLDQCRWPEQFDQIDETTSVVIFTEPYLSLNSSIINRVVVTAGAERALVVFDEASFMTASQVKRVTLEDITRFQGAVLHAQIALGEDGARLETVVSALDQLRDGREELSCWPSISRFDLVGATLAIQRAGQSLYGADFNYIGHGLGQLTTGGNAARWYDEDAYHCVPVPRTKGCDVIVFSPYLPPQIVEERLQRSVILALPPAVFRHSKTKMINIADPVGALRTLSSQDHFRRVADFFTALVLHDKAQGRRAVIVTKKVFLHRLQRHIEDFTKALGRPLICQSLQQFEAGGGAPETDVVLINYGIVGMNGLSDHDAVYCFGGYYAREAQLEDTYNQLLPPKDQIELVIRTENGQRRAQSGSPDARSRYHARRARAVLEMIERRVVVQAIGRVRPFTSPATVIAFQQDDLSSALGDIDTFSRLSRARVTLRVPSRTELVRATLGDHLRPDHVDGSSYRSIASKHGLPVSTVFKAIGTKTLDALLGEIRL